MRYKESREQSAELLRMVLPLMSRHSASFSPLSYAVWYEYVSGTNPRLHAALDARLAGGGPLNDDDVALLFDQYVVMRDLEDSARMRTQIQRLVDKVNEATTVAGVEVSQFGSELSGFHKQLQSDMDPTSLTGIVRGMLDDTVKVRDRTEVFQQSLRKSSQEVVRLREELEVVQGLALTDPLTGLLNRRGFDRQIRDVSANGLHNCSAIILDIDHFKAVNDAHGHMLGDKVIAAVAQVLKLCLEGRGQAARIGGEEFALLLTGTSAAGGAQLAEHIRAAIEKVRIRSGDKAEVIGNVTVSIGVATHVEAEQIEALMARADRALYQSKQSGRNRVTVAASPPGDPPR